MEFSRLEYWSVMPFPTPGDFPNPGIKPTSPSPLALAGGFFTHLGNPLARLSDTDYLTFCKPHFHIYGCSATQLIGLLWELKEKYRKLTVHDTVNKYDDNDNYSNNRTKGNKIKYSILSVRLKTRSSLCLLPRMFFLLNTGISLLIALHFIMLHRYCVFTN